MARLAYFIYDKAEDVIHVGDVDINTKEQDFLKEVLDVGGEQARFNNDLDRSTDLKETLADWDFTYATHVVN